MQTVEDQKLLELQMVNDGISRFNRTLNKMMDKGLESATKHGRAIISTQLDPVAKGIEELKNKSSNNREIARKKLQELDSEVAAYLAKKFGIPDGLIRDASERKQIMDMMQQAQMQQQQQQMMQQPEGEQLVPQ